MKKAIQKILTIISSLAVVIGIGQMAKAQDQTSSLLWKVSGNGLEQPSYIYGTIHLMCQDDLVIADQLKSAFDQTTLTVLEVDMDDPNMMTEAQKYAMNPGMANISEDLEESDLELLNQFFTENYNANLSQLGVMKPFALMSMTLPKLLSCQSSSYEQSFVQLSKEGKKEVIGLETMAFQMSLFDEIPTERQLEWLVESVEKTEEQKAELEQMITAYKNNDLVSLYEIITKNPQFAEYTDLLLNDRNENWIPQIEEIIKEQSAFIAVGAGHLAADKGVVALLKKQGYTVSPIQ